MFDKSKNIIFISRGKLSVFQIASGKKIERKLLLESEWNKDNLFEIFDKIKKDFGKEYRILIDESLSYVVELNFKNDEEINKEIIKKSAEELVPENLNETLWDYVKIPTTNKKETKIQVFALIKFANDCLVYAVNKAEFEIEAIEPIAFSLNRLILEQKISNYFLVYYSDLSNILFSSVEGLVLNSRIVEEADLEKEILLMKDYLKKLFSLDIDTIFIASEKSDLKAEALGLKIQNVNLDPVLSLAKKGDIKGKDEEVLNIWIPKIEINKKEVNEKIEEKDKGIEKEIDKDEKQEGTKEVEESKELQKKSLSFGKIILFVILGLLIAGVIAGGIFVYQQSMNANKKTIETPVAPISVSPTPIEEISSEVSSSSAKIADFKVKVLNGSGVAGAAGKLAEILKKAEFVVGTTGNADNSDYAQTIIEVKKEVSKEVLQTLDNTLKDLYDFKYSLEEISDPEYDIVIIIGKK